MRVLSLSLAAGAALLLAGCGQSGGSAKSADQLKAELPAPYNMGDVAAGKQVFLQCVACHSATEDGADMVGPNLYGIFGAKAGAHRPNFAYSPDMKAAGWTWDAEHIDHWVEDPRKVLPGTKMVFVGVKDPKQRQDLIAYLKVVTSGGPA